MKKILALPILAASLYGQPYYEVRSLGVASGFFASEGRGINNHGMAVGFLTRRNDGTSQIETRAFFYENCKMVELGTLGGPNSLATAVNDSGRVVGFSDDKNHINRAFSYYHGVMEDLGGPDFIGERALAISNADQAAGLEFLPGQSNSDNAVTYRIGSGQVTYLPNFESKRVTQATGVNEIGQVVGFQRRPGGENVGLIFFPNLGHTSNFGWFRMRGVTPSGRFPFMDLSTVPAAINRYDEIAGTAGAGVLHAFFAKAFFQPALDLGTLNPSDPASISMGAALNNKGWVVGSSTTAVPNQISAFLYDGREMIDLNTTLINGAGWHLRDAAGINDDGQIVGTGEFNGQRHAFILIPRPNGQPRPCLVGNK